MALAAVVGLVPVFAQLGHAQSLSESIPALPLGEELTDEELVLVDGELDPLTIVAAMIVNAGISAALDLAGQGIMIALGRKTELDLKEVGIIAGLGALTGPILAPKPAVTVVRSALVQGARWTAQAAKAVGVATVTVSQRVGEALHTVHVTLHNYVHQPLHNYVRQPIERFFKSAWDWIRGR